MAHKRKGVMVVSGERAKHLRPFEKRRVNKAERRAGKSLSLTEEHEANQREADLFTCPGTDEDFSAW